MHLSTRAYTSGVRSANLKSEISNLKIKIRAGRSRWVRVRTALSLGTRDPQPDQAMANRRLKPEFARLSARSHRGAGARRPILPEQSQGAPARRSGSRLPERGLRCRPSLARATE